MWAFGRPAALLALLLLAAAGGSAQTIEELQVLPGCEGANWEQYQVAAASPYCREWAANAVNQPCPVYCNDIVASLGEACYGEVSKLAWGRLGVTLDEPNVIAMINATVTACQSGQPLELGVAAAYIADALTEFPACATASAAPDALLTTGCSFELLADELAAPACRPECSAFLSALGNDCFMEFVLSGARASGVVTPDNEAGVAAQMQGLFEKCAGAGRMLLESDVAWDEESEAVAHGVLASMAAAAFPLLR